MDDANPSDATASVGDGAPSPPPGAPPLRQRWLSRRAISLHLLVLSVAPGCLAAGWWQATRALAGNSLSWVYSIEWPGFAVVAVVWWWNLVHEDPGAYAARRSSPAAASGAPPALPAVDARVVGTPPAGPVPRSIARSARRLAVACTLEFLLGFATLVAVPFDRPSGWIPHRGAVLYLLHGALGIVVTLGALAFVVRSRRCDRRIRILAWVGVVLLAAAGGGGLATEAGSLGRFFGIAVMFAGSGLAIGAYLVPPALAARAGRPALPEGVHV